jgi:hypothetical protein
LVLHGLSYQVLKVGFNTMSPYRCISHKLSSHAGTGKTDTVHPHAAAAAPAMQRQQQRHRSRSAVPHSLLLLLLRRRCHPGQITRSVFHQMSVRLAAAASTCRRVLLLGGASARSASWRLSLTMLALRATKSGEGECGQLMWQLWFTGVDE